MEIICEFNEPINLGQDGAPDWEYSEIKCENELYEFVENQTTTSSFYLKKSFTYGDFFVMGFLTIFFLILITKIIWQTFIKE